MKYVYTNVIHTITWNPSIPADQRYTVYCSAVRLEDATESWEFLAGQYDVIADSPMREHSPERSRLLSAMACPTDELLILRWNRESRNASILYIYIFKVISGGLYVGLDVTPISMEKGYGQVFEKNLHDLKFTNHFRNHYVPCLRATLGGITDCSFHV